MVTDCAAVTVLVMTRVTGLVHWFTQELGQFGAHLIHLWLE